MIMSHIAIEVAPTEIPQKPQEKATPAPFHRAIRRAAKNSSPLTSEGQAAKAHSTVQSGKKSATRGEATVSHRSDPRHKARHKRVRELPSRALVAAADIVLLSNAGGNKEAPHAAVVAKNVELHASSTKDPREGSLKDVVTPPKKGHEAPQVVGPRQLILSTRLSGSRHHKIVIVAPSPEETAEPSSANAQARTQHRAVQEVSTPKSAPPVQQGDVAPSTGDRHVVKATSQEKSHIHQVVGAVSVKIKGQSVTTGRAVSTSRGKKAPAAATSQNASTSETVVATPSTTTSHAASQSISKGHSTTAAPRLETSSDAESKASSGWTIQSTGGSHHDGATTSSWTIRPPATVGSPMKMELTQRGSELKADLTVSQESLGLLNATPAALPHQAVHLPAGVSTLQFSLTAQGGTANSGGYNPSQSGGGEPAPYYGRPGLGTGGGAEAVQPLGAMMDGIDYLA